jgi:tetratricopeptide (TPR) repeat protein
MEIDLIAFFQKIGKAWEKITGLLIVLGLIFVVYYNFIWDLIKDIPDYKLEINIGVYVVINLVTYVAWLFSTKRYFFRLGSDIVLGIHLSINHTTEKDEEIDYRIRKILNDLISEIHKKFPHKKLRIYLLPFGYLKTDEKKKRFLDNRSSMMNGLLDIQLSSGNYEDVEKMFIKEMHVLAQLNHAKKEKQVFFDKIEMQTELNLANYHKNWDYIFSNDGNDKIKLTENLKESILHFCGIYSIYLNKYVLALDFISEVFNPIHRKIESLERTPDGRLKAKLTGEQMVASRMATMLINIYSALAFDKLSNNEQEEAFQMFLKCEELGKNKYSYPMFIGMARISFELGRLDKAMEYNNKARNILPHGREIVLNEAWFAAINNNVPRFCNSYSNLVMKGIVKDQNYVDIIEFISRHKPDYPNASRLFAFMEGYINFECKINEELGRTTLINLQNEISNDNQYICLNQLITRVLNIQKVKINKSYSSNRIKKKSNRKKRH